MTVIVAVRNATKAVIAADTQETQGELFASGANRVDCEKIQAFDQAYIGLAGSATHHRVFQSLRAYHKERLDFTHGMAIFDTLCGLQEILEEEYYLLREEKDEDDSQPYGSNHLSGMVINPAGIFQIESYREVTEYGQYWAVGSGAEIALGALHVLYEMLDDPVEIARRAAAAACDLVVSCSEPIHLHTIDLDPNAPKARRFPKRKSKSKRKKR